jgi:hypothetical protein
MSTLATVPIVRALATGKRDWQRASWGYARLQQGGRPGKGESQTSGHRIVLEVLCSVWGASGPPWGL